MRAAGALLALAALTAAAPLQSAGFHPLKKRRSPFRSTARQ